MGRLVVGAERDQTRLFPPCLEDWIAEDNPVRVVDAFVDALNLGALGFAGVDAARTGRPGYHPAALLKLYVYGYLNRVPSSQRLEREAGSNVEVMWLTGQLSPDHKTIAEFRRQNGPAIGRVCARFVALCRKIGLLTGTRVAIDGSKFKAVNNCDRNFTQGKLDQRSQQIEGSVSRYLSQLDTADRQDPTPELAAKVVRRKEKIARLGQEMKRLADLEEQIKAAPDRQILLTDPDARSMATSGRGSGMVGYNVQVAVETEHHLIAAHAVTNAGSDRAQLSGMATRAKQALETDTLDAMADRGYYSGQEIIACERAGISVMLPRPMTSGAKAAGRFGKEDFLYHREKNAYLCPAGEMLSHRCTTVENGLTLHRYWTNACLACPLKADCTTGKERRVTRWEHETVQRRLDGDPLAMRVRRETVEHPFGTLKARMGATHFLTKTLPRVATEMALQVLAYNLTRVLNILGSRKLLAAIPT